MSNTILKSTFLFSSFVLLAQIIGLVRDLYLVSFFGVGPILDTYYLAFKIPDFLNVFYSVFLGSVILIPLLTKVKHEEGDDGVKKEISKIGSFVIVLVITFSAILFFLMPTLSQLLAPTWSTEQLNLLTNLSRTLLLAQLFFPIGIIAGAVGMVYGKPFGSAVAGFVYNFFILILAILLAPTFGIFGVVCSVIIASIFFAVVQYNSTEVRGIMKTFKFQINVTEWYKYFKRNSGRFITVFISQTYWLSILSLASLAGAGAITIFNNVYNVYLAIFYVVGGAFSMALMPSTSELYTKGEHETLKENLHNSLIYIFSFTLILSLLCFVFAKELISVLYYFTNISQSDLRAMVLLFGILAFSMPVLNLIEVIKKYFYSTNMIWSSTILATVFLFNIFFWNYIFSTYLAGFTSKIVLLTLSILVSNIFTCFAIIFILKYYQKIEIGFVIKNVYKSILAVLFASAAFYLTINYLPITYTTDFFVFAITKAVILIPIIILLVYLLNDQVIKSIIRKIISVIFRI